MTTSDSRIDLEGREWWRFVPEDQRAVYLKAGFSRSDRLTGRPALVVVDATVAFTGTRPMPVDEAIEAEFATSCGDRAWDAIPQIESLLGVFRSRGLPVVFTRPNYSDQSAMPGATKRATDARLESGQEFVEQLKPLSEEWICEKARASAFYGTILDAYLRLNEVSTVVLCGSTTSGCVRATSADGYSAGFRVFVAEDATFDRANHPHLASLFDIHAKYGTVMTTDEITRALAEPSLP